MVCLVLRERLETMVLRVILVLQDLQEQLAFPDLRCDLLRSSPHPKQTYAPLGL